MTSVFDKHARFLCVLKAKPRSEHEFSRILDEESLKHVFEITPDEFEAMHSCGVFDELADHFNDPYIDDYESTLFTHDLQWVNEVARKYPKDCRTLIEASSEAALLDTALAFFF